jgi:hypothetical protein
MAGRYFTLYRHRTPTPPPSPPSPCRHRATTTSCLAALPGCGLLTKLPLSPGPATAATCHNHCFFLAGLSPPRPVAIAASPGHRVVAQPSMPPPCPATASSSPDTTSPSHLLLTGPLHHRLAVDAAFSLGTCAASTGPSARAPTTPELQPSVPPTHPATSAALASRHLFSLRPPPTLMPL